MKYFLLVILLITIKLEIKGQSIFQKTIGDSLFNEYAFMSKEFKNNHYLILGRIENKVESKGGLLLIEIDESGNIVKQKEVLDTITSFKYIQMLDFNDKMYLFGVKNDNLLNLDSLVFSEIDTNLNIICVNSVYYWDSLSSGNVTASVFNKNTIMVSGYLGTTTQAYNYHSFSLLIDSNFTISKKNMNLGLGINPSELNNFIYNVNDSMYYSYITRGNNSFILKIDSNLVGDSISYQSNKFSFKQPIFISTFDSSCYIVVRLPDGRTTIYQTDLELDTLDSYFIETFQLPSYPAVNRSLSIRNNFYFVGVTEHINPVNIWWGGQDSYFHILKMDFSNNVVWEKKIGKSGNYYVLNDVLATDDGGCLLTGSIYEYQTNSYKKDIFIVKIDSIGSIVWEQEIKQSTIELSLYPNPTTTQLNITLKSPHKSIHQLQITDLQGKQILQKQINAKQTKLDVSSLSKGIYILEGSTNIGESFSRKFVKE